jgi:DNA-3-methyladenine glycosylase II
VVSRTRISIFDPYHPGAASLFSISQSCIIKLVDAAVVLTPERFLGFSDGELRKLGFSRQKTKYGRELSSAIINGDLDLAELHRLDDAGACDALEKTKGIGPWTADIYLLMALLRPDIWPSGDLALVKSIKKTYGFPEKPPNEDVFEFAKRWKPWRAVAARILWHDYLN